MTATTAPDGVAPRASGPFPPNHAWDRNFFLLYAGLAWLGIVMGFAPDIARHVQTHARPYPLIVHFHAVAFVGWLVLFTAQVLLIRARRLAVHRRLGLAMVALAALMMVLGPATALIADHAKIGTPDADPAFLAIQFTDIAAFVGLLGAAVAFRNRASIHKRLVLMATIYITDAGFARWLGDPLHSMLGDGAFSFWCSAYSGTALLFLGIGVYDLLTRRRLHPVHLAGLVWVGAMETAALGLYGLPSWKTFAAGLIAAA